MVQVSTFGNNGTSPLDQALKEWIELQEQLLRDGYENYEKYYEGDQGVKLTDRLKRFLPAGQEFRDNVCKVVVDTMVERLRLQGFESEDTALAEWAEELWSVNRMEQHQLQVHTEAAIKGNAFVLPYWDVEKGRVSFSFEPAELMVPRYDSTLDAHGRRVLRYVSKRWVTHGDTDGGEAVTRLNIYRDSWIEKYVARDGIWHKWFDIEDLDLATGEQRWPTPYVDADLKPLGVAVTHFRNRPAGDDFGRSEIADTIPLQDLINKAMVDLSQVLDTMGFKQRWIIGVKRPAQFSVTPGAVWVLQPESDPTKSQVGEFDVSNPGGILDALSMYIEHVAGNSRTPLHYFRQATGLPSGEALKAAESGLVEKVKLRQVGFGDSWVDLFQHAALLQNTFGDPIPGFDASRDMFQALWNDPETRNEKVHLEGLKVKAELGVPQAQIWREMGYDEKQIARMVEEAAEVQASDDARAQSLLEQELDHADGLRRTRGAESGVEQPGFGGITER